MPPEESESKPSRRAARQATRKRQPQNVRLGIFLTEADADTLDEEANANGLSVSGYLRILVARGRQALLAESEEARSGTPSPQDALAAPHRKAEEDRRLIGWRDKAQAKAIRRGTIQGRTT